MVLLLMMTMTTNKKVIMMKKKVMMMKKKTTMISITIYYLNAAVRWILLKKNRSNSLRKWMLLSPTTLKINVLSPGGINGNGILLLWVKLFCEIKMPELVRGGGIGRRLTTSDSVGL